LATAWTPGETVDPPSVLIGSTDADGQVRPRQGSAGWRDRRA